MQFLMPWSDPDPATAAARSEEASLLARAVDELPDPQREVVVMRLYAGLTFAQVADAYTDRGAPDRAARLAGSTDRFAAALRQLGQRLAGALNVPCRSLGYEKLHVIAVAQGSTDPRLVF